MVKARRLKPLPIFDKTSILKFFNQHGYKEVHLKTLWSLLVTCRPETITDLAHEFSKIQLPIRLLHHLKEEFAITTSKVVEHHVSTDGTTKLLVELQDGQRVEAVIIKHEGRNTLCVSSQIGCQMGCTFCATGTIQLQGNLMGGEIFEQLYHARGLAPIRNVVFMGMGEPLHNFIAVTDAVQAMIDTPPLSLSHNQITISTVGMIPQIRALTKTFPSINLALSLHAPNQELRAKIVPSAQAFPLDKLMNVCYEHIQASNKPLFIEYCMLKGVNDWPEHAHELGKLLQGYKATVNLMPYNPTDVAMEFDIPDEEDVKTFHRIIAVEYKILCTIRIHHGRDIAGACGQLALLKPGAAAGVEGGGNSSSSSSPPGVGDIEDLMLAGQKRRGRKEGEGPGGQNRSIKVSSRAKKGSNEAASPPPEFISCSRFTWILSVLGTGIMALVVLVLLRIGITVYLLKDPPVPASQAF